MSVTTINLGKLRVNWRGAWTTSTAYQINDAVSNSGSSYICVTANTSGSSFATDLAASYWQLMAQGNSANTTAGDITYYNSGANQRLGIGSTGQVLTVSSSGIPSWTLPSVTGLVYYVTPEGSDTNTGTSINSAFASIQKATQAVSGQAATIVVKSGTYAEILPITVPPNVSIVGDGMRDTIITPKVGGTVTATYNPTGSSGTTLNITSPTGTVYVGMTVSGTNIAAGTKVATVVSTTQVILSAGPSGTPSGTITFTWLSLDASPVANNLSTMFYMSDSTLLQGVLMTGMTGFVAGGTPSDITTATIGGVYLRLNPATTITNKSPYIKDCTAKSSGGVGAIVDGTFESGGNVSMVFWAYNIVMDNGVGIWALNGGRVEAVSVFTYYAYFGYVATSGGQIRSLSGNNSYGTYGAVSAGYLASETATTGTVYGNMLTYSNVTLTGTFQSAETISQNATSSLATTGASSSAGTSTITFATQGANPYAIGQTIIVAGVTPSGFNGTKVVTGVTTSSVSFAGSTAGPQTVAGTITAVATATVTSVQTGYLYYKQLYGTFNATNVVTGATSGATMTPTVVGGQANYLIILSGLTASPAVGASISFAGDSTSYVIQAVSGSWVNTSSIITITLAQQKVAASTDGTAVTIRYNFSLIRLQGHDFLYIGTGGISATNYPNVVPANAIPSNQIVFTYPGRVYYVSTDQAGNFNVGQYFSVNQATGAATLNANAFSLSGLQNLRLGSIGAQLGASINEFSTDITINSGSGSAVKVPTQSAVTGYLGATYQTIAPSTDLGYDLGTPTKRWGHLYVGPGSITLGTITLTDNSGTLSVGGGGNMTVPGNLIVTGSATFNGSTTYVQGNNTIYTDNLIELHAPSGGVGGTWATNDGKDIGLRMHYYSGSDQNAALVLANDSGFLEWYNTGTENGSGDFVGATYGTIKTATFQATTSFTTSNTTFNHINTIATTVNEYGAATTINVAANAGAPTTMYMGSSANNNILSVLGNGTSGTTTITTNVVSGTANLFAGVTGTINIGGAGATINVAGKAVASTGKAIAMAIVFS